MTDLTKETFEESSRALKAESDLEVKKKDDEKNVRDNLNSTTTALWGDVRGLGMTTVNLGLSWNNPQALTKEVLNLTIGSVKAAFNAAAVFSAYRNAMPLIEAENQQKSAAKEENRGPVILRGQPSASGAMGA